MELRKVKKQDYPAVKELYLSAFPARERKPFFMLMQKRHEPGVLVLEEEGFCGFISLITWQDVMYVDYFAVDPGLRGRKLGSRVLEELQKRYPDHRIMLEIERLDELADNNAQRIRRRKFYERSGFEGHDNYVRAMNCEFELLCWNGNVAFTEYKAIQKQAFGSLVYGLMKKPVERT